MRQPAARLLIGMLAHLQAADTVPPLESRLICSHKAAVDELYYLTSRLQPLYSVSSFFFLFSRGPIEAARLNA